MYLLTHKENQGNNNSLYKLNKLLYSKPVELVIRGYNRGKDESHVWPTVIFRGNIKPYVD